MWKRIELHNHTMESDGSMTVKELAAFMEARGSPGFPSRTTTQSPASQICPRPAKTGLQYVCGYELTSYYGICSARM